MRLIRLIVLFNFLSVASFAAVDLNTLKSVFKALKKSKIRYNFKTKDDIAPKKKKYYSRVYSVANEKNFSLLENLLKKGDFKAARLQLKQHLSIDRYDSYLYYLLGESYRGEKNNKKAFQFYKKAIFLNVNCEKTWKRLSALGYEFKGRRVVKEKADVRRVRQDTVNIVHFPSKSKVSNYSWMTFAMAKALWVFEGGYKHIFPESLWYMKSFAEVSFCYELMLFTWQKAKDKKDSEISIVDEDLDYLLDLKSRGMLKGYLFLEIWRPLITAANSRVLVNNKSSIDKYFKSIIEKM